MNEIISIAIDDEPMALSVIQQFCQRSGGIRLYSFSDPHLGLQAIDELRPQLVFLDIEMDEINGLDIARRLPKGCCLIFTTAYMEYALDGFELDAVDFLHKPFAYERFEKAVQKAFRRLSFFQKKEEPSGSLVVKQEYNNISIPLSEILYIEAMENYSKIFRTQKHYVLTRMNLKSIQSLLPESGFLRIHRSYLIATDKVIRFTRREVTLCNEQILPIGRQYTQNVFSELQKSTKH